MSRLAQCYEYAATETCIVIDRVIGGCSYQQNAERIKKGIGLIYMRIEEHDVIYVILCGLKIYILPKQNWSVAGAI